MALKLIIGNKNYSSWSLRPWLLMVAFDIPFEEMLIPLDAPDFKTRVREYSPAGRVPALVDDGAVVWESIAILEHLAERNPAKPIWPRNPEARAHARSLATEMHGGFAALRRDAPMNLSRPPSRLALADDAQKDVRTLLRRWREARERFGSGGDFLYGDFCAADAMYAPVATRLRTYAIDMDDVGRAYVDAIHAHPAFVRWRNAAFEEGGVIREDEVDWPNVKRVPEARQPSD